MSNYLKLFKSEFEKYAQEYKGRRVPKATPAAAPAPAGTATTPARKPAPTGGAPQRGQHHAPTGGGAGGGNGPASIRDMQNALIDLSKAVTSQIKIEDIAPKEQIPSGTVVDKDHPLPAPTSDQTQAAGRGSFNDFIAKRMRGAGGVEFDPNPNKKEMKDKLPSEATRMNVIMDTMRRIGNPKGGEFSADGAWGPRTNAGLRNAYAFAAAMLKLADDFKVKPTAYNENALQQFRVPETDTEITPAQKAEYAPIYAKHVRAIKKMYDQIKADILEKPAYQAYIEGDQPYATFDEAAGKETPKAPVVIDPQAMASLQARFKEGFPIEFYDSKARRGKTVLIFVQDLMSPAALQAWSYKQQTDQDPTHIINQVKDRIAGRPIKPLPLRYLDTLSPSEREAYYKRHPDDKKEDTQSKTQEEADRLADEKNMAQQRAQQAGA